jgi:hypothetical protein
MDLEDKRRRLEEREREQRRRAERLVEEMGEMGGQEREVAKRLLQSLFPDDDEGVHQVQRKQSHMVGDYFCAVFLLITTIRSLCQSLSSKLWKRTVPYLRACRTIPNPSTASSFHP